jgi:hypothetical protein
MFAAMGIATGLGDLSQGPPPVPVTPNTVPAILMTVVASVTFEIAPITHHNETTVLAWRREHWVQQRQPAPPPRRVRH